MYNKYIGIEAKYNIFIVFSILGIRVVCILTPNVSITPKRPFALFTLPLHLYFTRHTHDGDD